MFFTRFQKLFFLFVLGVLATLPQTSAGLAAPTIVKIERLGSLERVRDGTYSWIVEFSEDVFVSSRNFSILGDYPPAKYRVGTVARFFGGASPLTKVWRVDLSQSGSTAPFDGILNLGSSFPIAPDAIVEAYSIDSTYPDFVSVKRRTPLEQLTNESSVVFEVKFTEAMAPLPSNAFTFKNVGTVPPGATISGAQDPNDAAIFLVTVAGISNFEGEFGIQSNNILSTPEITDLLGNNLLPAVGWAKLEAVLDNPDHQSFIVDMIAPVPTISITSSNANPSFAGPGDVITITQTFNEHIANDAFGPGAPVVTAAASGDNFLTQVYAQNSNSPTTITSTYKIPTGAIEGAFDYSISTTYFDPAGNSSTAPAGGWRVTDGSSVTVDTQAPVASSFTPISNGGPDATSFSWQVEFNEPVGGVDANDFDIGGFVDNPTVVVTPVGQSGNATGFHDVLRELWGVMPARAASMLYTQFIVTASGGTRDQDAQGATISLTANPTIVDAIGSELVDNEPTAPAPAPIPFADIVAPTVAIAADAMSIFTSTLTPFTATFTFSEDVFPVGDALGAINAALSNAVASNFQTATDFTVFTATITPSGHGLVEIGLGAGSVEDESGNLNTAAAPIFIGLIDDTPPRVKSIVRQTSETTDEDTLVWRVNFNKPVFGFDSGDLEITGPEGELTVVIEPIFEGATTTRQATGGIPVAQSYTVTVSGGGIADGNLVVDLALADNSTVRDLEGNELTDPTPTDADEGAIIVINDDVSPSVMVSGPTDVRGAFTVTFTFSEPVTGFEQSDIAASNAVISALAGTDDQSPFSSVFTATATPIEQGTITIGVNGGAAADAAGNASLASDTLVINYIDVAYVQTRTGAVINNFLHRRAKNILANEPDLSGRLSESGGIGVTEKFAFRAEGSEGELNIDFAGSLTRQRITSPLALGYGGNVAQTLGAGGLQKYNVWVRGSLSKYESDGVVQDFGIIHLGADYRVNEAFIVGAMAQVDWADEADPAANTATSGTGWMIGPYAVIRLHDNLIFDGRVGWGQSDNEVSPFGTYVDDFETDRFLVRGQLTGDFDYAGWNIAPQISLTYIREQQKAYVDANDITINARNVELGQMAFGPKISKRFDASDDASVNASFGLKGIWDFKDTGILNIEDGTVSNGNGEDLTARFDFGLDVDFSNGAQLGVAAFYEGIGASDSKGYGGSVKAHIPF